MAIDPYPHLIWSADVDNEAELMKRLAIMPHRIRPKIDRLLQSRCQPGLIRRLTDRGWEVFDDAKIAEIPTKAEALARVQVEGRPWMLNCMAGICSTGFMTHEDPDKVDGLKRFADVCAALGIRSCGVTVLTSKSPELALAEFGRPPIDQVLFYVDLLNRAGFTDIVCSPDEVAAIRAESAFAHLDTNSPGIRPSGSAAGDQARVDTPGNLIRAGGTRAVIGRPFTNDETGEVVLAVANEVEAALIELEAAA